MYKLITKRQIGSFCLLILNLPFLKKLKYSMLEIIDAHIKLGEFFFKNKLYNLTIDYLKNLARICEDDANLYYLIGASYAFNAYNTLNINKYK